MKSTSSRMKSLLSALLLLWKKEKRKTGQVDPAIERAIASLTAATEKNTLLSEEELLGIEALVKSKKKSTLSKWCLETILTLVIALCLAILIRQMWFELYEIPTGSMRPTFKEQDRVLVSKTAFGLNMPLMTKHLSFSKKRLCRGSIVVITGDKLDLPDTDTTYFGLFPAKKRYVKRLVGLPDEYLYFYGGDIYILKSDGKTIERLRSIRELADKEYLPFISFEGKIEAGKETSRFSRNKEFLLLHFDQPVGKVEISSFQRVRGRIFSGGEWIEEFQDKNKMQKERPQTLGDFFGIDNYAKCRLLLPSELPSLAEREGYVYPDATAYLELHHSPSLPNGSLSAKSISWPLVQTKTTFLPLHDAHIEALVRALTTARFVVSKGRVHRYNYESKASESIPLLKEIPDGTYEFINGTAYRIVWGGYAETLPSSHPLYPSKIEELIFWYNGGIDMHPDMFDIDSNLIPSRYGYFKEGTFYAMGMPLVQKEDPILNWFIVQEINRQARESSYFAFQDHGSPEMNGLDPSFFKSYGLHIPKGHYLVLGDNHAMSVDGRFFGTIPEANIQGSPLCILWPPGERWGYIPQPKGHIPSPWSILFSSLTLTGYLVYRVRLKRREKQIILLCKQKEAQSPSTSTVQ